MLSKINNPSMSYRHLLTAVGVTLIVFGWVKGGWLLFAVWLGFNFLALGIAHGRGWPRIFGKQAGGTLSLWSWAVFLPLHIYTFAVWHLIRLVSREPAYNAVSENLAVGRRLLPFELDGQFANYVDLTAEFPEPSAIRKAASYRCFPILDGAAPTPGALHAAIASLRPGRTFVHCAQGHGRTGLFAAALLLHSGEARHADDALRMLAAARPAIRLSKEQQQCLREYASRGT